MTNHETAPDITYSPLTKIDIAAIRAADTLTVHLGANNPMGRVRLIKRQRPSAADPFARDVEHALSVEVEIEGLRGQEELTAGRVQCFAMASLYHVQHCHASSTLRTLRVGDEISFSFYPDAHSNGYLAAAGLHVDTLQLRVRRNGKTVAVWELVSSLCPDNSARMCRGVPNSPDYDKAANDARKLAM